MADNPTASAKKSNLGWVLAPLVIFGALVAVFAFALQTGDPSRLPSALIGKPAPATEFPAVDGLVDAGRPVPGFRSAELATGKPSVVNFWASWCVPCADEAPLLLDLQRAGVTVYGVNYKDDASAARRFLGRYGNPYLAVGTDAVGRGAIEWGVYGMPETFVLNGKGEIVFKHVGPITADSIKSKLLPALAAAQSAVAAPEK